MGTSKTLDEIIQNLLIDEGKNSEAEYLRYFNIALRGLKELNMDAGKDIKSIELTVLSNGSVDFPADYVGYTKLGRIDSDGRVHVLGVDRRRVRKTTFQSTSIINSTDSDDYFIFKNFMFNGNLGSIYGIGGGNNAVGYYTEDRKNNRFIFNGGLKGKRIVLEYITDGSSDEPNGEINVDPYLEEALMAFIYWRSIQRKRGIQQFEKESARREYYNEKRLAVARLNKFTKEEALQTTRKAFKQSPKL